MGRVFLSRGHHVITVGDNRICQEGCVYPNRVIRPYPLKGMDLWSWVDVISVMVIAIGFTYTAWKTRTLVAGIVFHFLHDAFLFLPQVPGAEYIGVLENVAYFGSLWVMVGVGCMLTKFSSDRLGVKADEELYTLDVVPSQREV
jgi:hypothetical protein